MTTLFRALDRIPCDSGYTATMRISATFFALVASVLFLSNFGLMPRTVSAHGTGLTFTSTTTDYYVDVDYSDFFVVAGIPGRFDFKLFTDEARTQPVDFTQVWARVVRTSDKTEGTTVFSGWIAKALFGSTGMSITLHDVGAYNLVVRYNNGDNQIIEATLPFEVVQGQSEPFAPDRNFWFGFVAGCAVLLCAFLGYRIATQRRR